MKYEDAKKAIIESAIASTQAENLSAKSAELLTPVLNLATTYAQWEYVRKCWLASYKDAAPGNGETACKTAWSRVVKDTGCVKPQAPSAEKKARAQVEKYDSAMAALDEYRGDGGQVSVEKARAGCDALESELLVTAPENVPAKSEEIRKIRAAINTVEQYQGAKQKADDSVARKTQAETTKRIKSEVLEFIRNAEEGKLRDIVEALESVGLHIAGAGVWASETETQDEYAEEEYYEEETQDE